MSNVHQFPDQSSRFDEASLWIAKLDNGLSNAEEKALKDWLSQDSENAAVFLKMAEVWDKMDSLDRLSHLFPQPVHHRNQGFSALARVASVAAVLLVGVWMAAIWLPLDNSDSGFVANVQGLYQTTVGESSEIDLPDGTRLVLNTNSSVRVSYSERQRILFLERGEINVDVAHDETRPLSVVVGDQIIQAVGTQFNVELNSDQKI